MQQDANHHGNIDVHSSCEGVNETELDQQFQTMTVMNFQVSQQQCLE
jgi:hypothetical protein